MRADQRAPNRAVSDELNRAQTCLSRGDGPQAVRILQAAVALVPDDAELCLGLGVSLRFVGDIDAAAAAFMQVLALQPGRADAQVYLGMIRLAQGHQQDGWSLYQARWRSRYWPEPLRYPLEALWQGTVQPGMRVLLWGEQGFGDIIQFARYAPWLARQLHAHGATLVLEAPAPLCRLFRISWPFMTVMARSEAQGAFDAHLPLMDLPHRWCNCVGSAGLPYLPEQSPYLSALADPLAPKRGTVRVAGCARSRPLKVGLTWQGRPTHPDDRWRSIPLERLEPLFAVPGVSWVSLQKDALQHPLWLPEDMDQCQDFSETAGIVSHLDLVISIDSAVAHLAAALGRPVWLLLPVVADWRWGLADDVTPWYAGMRLFRQRAQESWDDVIARVAAALEATTAFSDALA